MRWSNCFLRVTNHQRNGRSDSGRLSAVTGRHAASSGRLHHHPVVPPSGGQSIGPTVQSWASIRRFVGRQAQTRASRLGGEKRREDFLADSIGMPGPSSMKAIRQVVSTSVDLDADLALALHGMRAVDHRF